MCVTPTHKNAKAWTKRPMHRPTGEQDTRDGQNSGYCDGQLEVEAACCQQARGNAVWESLP